MADEICKEYESSLKDLVFNSKPHISMMTMLAEENVHYAPQIVKVIEAHLQKVKAECKLPTMYLIDSIVKNVGSAYSSLFVQNLVSNFCAVFEKVDEKVRMQLYKLRQTWADIFPNKKLYAIDVRVKQLDPAWPITAQAPQQSSIHFNPKFLKPTSEETVATKKVQDKQEDEMRKQLLSKQQELLKLQRQKLELELLQTQVMVEEQKRQLILKEQQVLRVQQNAQVEVQKVLQQQVSQSVTAITSSVGDQRGLNAKVQDSSRSNQNKVDFQTGSLFKSIVPGQQSESNVHGSNSKQPDRSASTTAIISQTVISSLVLNNKTSIETNSVGVKRPFGFNNNTMDPLVFSPKIVSPGIPGSSGLSNSKSPVKKSDSIVTISCKQLPLPAILAPPLSLVKQGSNTVGGLKDSKTKISSGKATSKVDTPKKNKEAGKKQQTPSPTKKKDASSKSSSNSKSESTRGTSRKKDLKEGGSSSKGSSKSTSKGKTKSSSSVSPASHSSKLKTEHSSRSSSRGRSRSPGRSGEKEERPSKRGHRSPRKEKENDGKGSGGDSVKSKTFSFSSHKLDVDLRTPLEAVTMKRDRRSASLEKSTDGEPPDKKSKSDDPDLDDIFSGKDQDYRQLGHPVPRLSPISEKSWAQYKASRPEEFKNPVRSKDGDPFGFGNQDLDLRPTSMGHGAHQELPWMARDPRMAGHRDPRMRRNDFRSNRSRFSPRDLLPQQQIYQATQESDPNIPRALMFDRGADIMRQADQQLRSGQLTLEQHAELMEQLAKLYELQRMRHMQREQHVRETVILSRKLSHEDVMVPDINLPIDKVEVPNQEPTETVSPMDTTESKPTEKQDESVEVLSTSDVNTKPKVDDVVVTNTESKPEDDNDIEVIVIDDGPISSSKPEVKRKESRWSSPVGGPPSHFRHPITINTVMIDDKPREVRFVEGKAIVLLDNDDVREIGFRGPPQEVSFDKVAVRLEFGNMTKEFELNGNKHTVRFGAPTREIIIDGVPYAAVFGGPSVVVQLNGKPCEVRLSGPTPEVFFGDKPRSDLLTLLGREKLPVPETRNDNQLRRPPQRPESPMRWMPTNVGRDYDNHNRDWKQGRDNWHESSYLDDGYRRGQFHRVEPRSRDDYEPWGREDDFLGMPRGGMMGRGGDRVRSGRHGSPQMDDGYDRHSRDSPYRDSIDQRQVGGPGSYYGQRDQRFHPSFHSGPPRMGHPMGVPPHTFDNSAPGNHMHRPQMRSPAMVQYPIPFGYRNVPQPSRQNFGPPVCNDFNFNPNVHHQGVPTMVPPPPMPVPPPPPQIDVGELFSKLVATGIIQQVAANPTDKKADEIVNEDEPMVQQQQQEKEGDVVVEKIPTIELATECLKVRQPLVITQLYYGIQCSSCGVRFTSEQTDKYAQHLDWHFRQNRREKSSARKALSRKWYYDIQDWVQFEEIEDLEERARSFFELQVNEDQVEGVEESTPSVPAGEEELDKKCCVCQEPFELYWDEEHEEWHFRDAIRKDEKNYHPLCFEDIEERPGLADNLEEVSDAVPVKTETDEREVKVDIKNEIEMESIKEESDNIKEEIKDGSDVKVESLLNNEVSDTVCNGSVRTEDGVLEAAMSLPAEVVSSEGVEVTVSEQSDAMEVEKEGTEEKEVHGGEPEKDNDEETTAHGDLFSVFNVTSTNYSIPPLIGFDVEQPKDTDEPVNEANEETELDAVAEIESEVKIAEEKEEESQLNICPTEDEKMETTSSTENETEPSKCNETGDTVIENVIVAVEQVVEEVLKIEDVEVKSVLETTNVCSPQMETENNSVDVEGANGDVCDEVNPRHSSVSSEPRTDEDILVASVILKDEEDISLKESSDVIVDYAFDQPDKLIVEGEDDKSNDGSDDDDGLPRFKVLPPVERGTELSGLCSIM